MDAAVQAFTKAAQNPIELFTWLFLAAVGVIGTVEFIKSGWLTRKDGTLRKRAIKYAVLIISILSSICVTSLTPMWLSIAWLSLTVVLSLSVLLNDSVIETVKRLLSKL